MGDFIDTQRIPPVRFEWLTRESERWRDGGVLDEAGRTRLLAYYEPEPAQARGMTALVVLAALMVGIGVLLLIGYNWARLGPVIKVAITMSGVAAFFAASAFAAARRHNLAAETLALIGTFAYANSIWLIAQVLHIQGHFPDGFMWSAVGALAAALVIGSKWIAIEAAIFSVAWVWAAGVVPPYTPPLAFLVVGPAAIAAAYALSSPVMLRIAAFAIALFVLLIDWQNLFDNTHVVLFSAVCLTGCAYYAIGAWHSSDVSMRRAWQSTGLLVLLVSFLVLLIADFHREVLGGNWWNGATVAGLVALAITVTLARRRARDVGALAILTAATVVVIWTALVVSGIRQPQHVWVTVFSALALMVSVALIRTALLKNDGMALTFGTLFGLEFLIVRWTSVIENMLWSGLMLLAAGGGLLLIARLWRHRDRTYAVAGRIS